MALTKCPACKKDVSLKAMTCPNCAHPLREEFQARAKRQAAERAKAAAEYAEVAAGLKRFRLGCLGLAFALAVTLFVLPGYKPGWGLGLAVVTLLGTLGWLSDAGSRKAAREGMGCLMYALTALLLLAGAFLGIIAAIAFWNGPPTD